MTDDYAEKGWMFTFLSNHPALVVHPTPVLGIDLYLIVK